MVDELEEQAGEEEEQEAQEETLIFGKYKDLADAEKGYKELERQFHASRQGTEKPEEDFGYVTPSATAATTEQPETQDPTDALLENPVGFILQAVGMVRQSERIANANRRAALKELRDHPAYKAVSDELESSLEEIDPAYLQHPQQARQIIRAMFGERLVERTAKAEPVAPSSTHRARPVELEEPTGGSEDNAPEATIDADGEALLRSLGLGTKERKSVTESWRNRGREDRR